MLKQHFLSENTLNLAQVGAAAEWGITVQEMQRSALLIQTKVSDENLHSGPDRKH